MLCFEFDRQSADSARMRREQVYGGNFNVMQCEETPRRRVHATKYRVRQVVVTWIELILIRDVPLPV